MRVPLFALHVYAYPGHALHVSCVKHTRPRCLTATASCKLIFPPDGRTAADIRCVPPVSRPLRHPAPAPTPACMTMTCAAPCPPPHRFRHAPGAAMPCIPLPMQLLPCGSNVHLQPVAEGGWGRVAVGRAAGERVWGGTREQLGCWHAHTEPRTRLRLISRGQRADSAGRGRGGGAGRHAKPPCAVLALRGR